MTMGTMSGSMPASIVGTATTGSGTGTVSAPASSSTAASGGGEDQTVGVVEEATDELSFDRGIWKTDEDGHFTLYDTIPGWYSGRAVHTHLKVYDESSGYQADNGTFVANNTAYHTGQWFWPQDLLAQLADLSPYSLNALSYNDSTKNDEDMWYPYAAENNNEAELTVTWIDANDIMAGVIASTVVGVNLTYSSVELSTSYWSGNITQAEEATGITDSDASTVATDGAVKSFTYLTSATVVVIALAHFTLSL